MSETLYENATVQRIEYNMRAHTFVFMDEALDLIWRYDEGVFKMTRKNNQYKYLSRLL